MGAKRAVAAQATDGAGGALAASFGRVLPLDDADERRHALRGEQQVGRRGREADQAAGVEAGHDGVLGGERAVAVAAREAPGAGASRLGGLTAHDMLHGVDGTLHVCRGGGIVEGGIERALAAQQAQAPLGAHAERACDHRAGGCVFQVSEDISAAQLDRGSRQVDARHPRLVDAGRIDGKRLDDAMGVDRLLDLARDVLDALRQLAIDLLPRMAQVPQHLGAVDAKLLFGVRPVQDGARQQGEAGCLLGARGVRAVRVRHQMRSALMHARATSGRFIV